MLVRALWPDSAYVWLFGIALFGALFVWLMIFVTHIAYRASGSDAGRGGLPALGSWMGAALIAAILVSTWWVPGLRSTLIAGGHGSCCWRSATACRPSCRPSCRIDRR